MRFFYSMLLMTANIILVTAACVALFCVFPATADAKIIEIIIQNPLLFPFVLAAAAVYSLKYSIPLSIVAVSACCIWRWFKKRP